MKSCPENIIIKCTNNNIIFLLSFLFWMGISWQDEKGKKWRTGKIVRPFSYLSLDSVSLTMIVVNGNGECIQLFTLRGFDSIHSADMQCEKTIDTVICMLIHQWLINIKFNGCAVFVLYFFVLRSSG